MIVVLVITKGTLSEIRHRAGKAVGNTSSQHCIEDPASIVRKREESLQGLETKKQTGSFHS